MLKKQYNIHKIGTKQKLSMILLNLVIINDAPISSKFQVRNPKINWRANGPF